MCSFFSIIDYQLFTSITSVLIWLSINRPSPNNYCLLQATGCITLSANPNHNTTVYTTNSVMWPYNLRQIGNMSSTRLCGYECLMPVYIPITMHRAIFMYLAGCIASSLSPSGILLYIIQDHLLTQGSSNYLFTDNKLPREYIYNMVQRLYINSLKVTTDCTLGIYSWQAAKEESGTGLWWSKQGSPYIRTEWPPISLASKNGDRAPH